MVYDLCKGGPGRMALFNLSIIQFLLQVRHAGEFTCNHCFFSVDLYVVKLPIGHVFEIKVNNIGFLISI